MTPQHSDHNEVAPDIHSDQRTTVNSVVSASALKCREFIKKFSECAHEIDKEYLIYSNCKNSFLDCDDQNQIEKIQQQEDKILALIENKTELLKSIEFPDFTDIKYLCNELETHRDQLVELIRLETNSTSSSEVLIISLSTEDLVEKEMRQFLFSGETQIALFRYRDHQKTPVTELSEKEINQIEINYKIFLTAIEAINQSLEDHFLANLTAWEENLKTLQKTTNIIESYREYKNRISDSLIGRDDYTVIRRSFIHAVTPICLKNYSYISVAIIKKLITMKSTNYITVGTNNKKPPLDDTRSINSLIDENIDKFTTKTKSNDQSPTIKIMLDKFIKNRRSITSTVAFKNNKQAKEEKDEQKKIEGVNTLNSVMTDLWRKPLGM